MKTFITLLLVLSSYAAFAADPMVCRPNVQNPGFSKYVNQFEIIPFGRSGATLLVYASEFQGSRERQRPVKYRLDRFARRQAGRFVIQYIGRSTDGRETVAINVRTNGVRANVGTGVIAFDSMNYPVFCSGRP